MTLKATIDSLDGLNEHVAALYTQGDDGKYRVVIEGGDDLTKLKGALEKEREARRALEKAQSEGGSKLAEAEKRFQESEDARLTAEGKTQELAAKQVERMKADFDKQLLAKDEFVSQQTKRAQAFERQVYENNVRKAAEKAGVHHSAIEDVVLRAQTTFKLGDDGSLFAGDEDGSPVYGKDGKTPLTVDEWLDGTRETAPHWFPAQSGSGTRGGGSGSVSKSYADCKTDDERVAFLKTTQ